MIVVPFLKALQREEQCIGDTIETSKEIAKRAFSEALPKFSDLIQTDKAYDVSSELELIRSNKMRVKNDVQEIWERPLTILEVLIEISYEASIEFRVHLSPEIQNEEYLLRALLLLHSRGRRTCSEILLLLNNGYADGAYARWRTLHELAVTTTFITDQRWKSERNELAERYLHHYTVGACKKAEYYQEIYEKRGEASLSKEQIEELKSERDRLCKPECFGPNFKNNYGWAEKAFGKIRKASKPGKEFNATFANLEEAVGYEFYRPNFAFASNGIHAGSVAENVQLGFSSLEPLPETERSLSGPSIYGLTLPIYDTANSLVQITSATLLTVPLAQWTAIVSLMYLLSDKCYEACRKVEENLTTLKPKPYL